MSTPVIDQLDQLVQLVGTWQPDYASKLAGASPESIARLEARMRGRLDPAIAVLRPEHRAFLERMGESHGGINAYGDDVFDLRCEALLEYMDHEDIRYDLGARLFELVAAPKDLLVEPLVLDLRAHVQSVEPAPLVRFGGYDEHDGDRPMTAPEHSSLMAMLFLFAFSTKCLPRFAWQRTLRSPGTKRPQFPDCPPGRWLPHFEVVVKRLGFVPIPNTGPWAVCAQRQDAAVSMYECPGYAPDVDVAAADRDVFNNLVELLCDNLELRPYPGTLRQPA
jgi:hypothetical protein